MSYSKAEDLKLIPSESVVIAALAKESDSVCISGIGTFEKEELVKLQNIHTAKKLIENIKSSEEWIQENIDLFYEKSIGKKALQERELHELWGPFEHPWKDVFTVISSNDNLVKLNVSVSDIFSVMRKEFMSDIALNAALCIISRDCSDVLLCDSYL